MVRYIYGGIMHTKLRKLRNEKNITVYKMAEILKISPSFYTQIENNKRTLTYEMAVKIAKIFNKKPDKIFYEDYLNNK